MAIAGDRFSAVLNYLLLQPPSQELKWPLHETSLSWRAAFTRAVNRLMAKALAALAGSCSLVVEIGGLPFYNEDVGVAGPPAPWIAFRQAIAAADTVLFIATEYNRSVP